MQVLAALIGGDHAVDRQDQGRLGDGRVAFAQRAEHHQHEGGQRQPDCEWPGVGKQQLDGHRGDAEAQQRHHQRDHAPPPAVVGFRQGAGDDAQE